MRYAVIVFAAVIAFGETQKQTKSGNKPADRSESKSTQVEVVVPAGATEISPGVYKHTDTAGKTWIYRKTPFGLVKKAESETSAPQPATAPAERANPFGDASKSSSANPTSANSGAANVTAIEEGDVVKFERKTPFGPSKWTRKKSELTADELEIVEKSRSRQSDNTGTK